MFELDDLVRQTRLDFDASFKPVQLVSGEKASNERVQLESTLPDGTYIHIEYGRPEEERTIVEVELDNTREFFDCEPVKSSRQAFECAWDAYMRMVLLSRWKRGPFKEASVSME